MKRRKALQNIGLATVIIPAGLFVGCKEEGYQGKFFKRSTIELINEIGETILPETEDSPGAKAAKVGNFLDSYVAECIPAAQQELLRNGLLAFDESVNKKMSKSYEKLSAQERHDYLTELDAYSKEFNATLAESTTPHFFPLFKNLILFAYFTSKEGATKALRYLPIPGRYEGNYAFAKGDKAWAL